MAKQRQTKMCQDKPVLLTVKLRQNTLHGMYLYSDR